MSLLNRIYQRNSKAPEWIDDCFYKVDNIIKQINPNYLQEIKPFKVETGAIFNLEGGPIYLDHNYEKLLIMIHDEIEKHAPTDYPLGNLDKMLCLPFYYTNPIAHAPIDTKVWRKNIGLKPPSKQFLKFITIFANELFNHMDVSKATFKVNAHSNPGIPFIKNSEFDQFSGEDYERAIAKRTLTLEQAGRLGLFLDEVVNCDLINLANDFGAVILNKPQIRIQYDSPEKKRFYPDMEFVQSGGLKGTIKQSDKIYTNKFGYHLPSGKGRLVFGMGYAAGGLSYFLFSLISNVFKRNLFHFRGVDDLNERLKSIPYEWDVMSFDVSNYDFSITGDMYNAIMDSYLNIFSEDIVTYFGMLNLSPTIYPECDMFKEGNKHVCIGDPFDFNQMYFGMGKSGLFDVSLKAKMLPAASILYAWLHYRGLLDIDDAKLKEIINLYVNQDANLGFVAYNGGDNNLLLGPKRILEGITNSAKTLGDLFIFEDDKIPTINGFMIKKEGYLFRGMINPFNNLNNMMHPERGAGTSLRPYPNIGIADRYELAKMNSHIAFNMDTFERCFWSVYGRDFKKEHIGALKTELGSLPSNLSKYDILFIENPDSIYYKLDEDLVNPEILDKFRQSFSSSEIKYIIKRCGKHLKFDVSYFL